MMKNILTIAESDPTGIKGIQADVKTITAMGGYALSAITYISSGTGLQDIKAMEPDFVASQIRSAIGEFEVSAVKIGSLLSEEIVNAAADVMEEYVDSEIPIVIDPNIVARDGRLLMDEDMLGAVKRRLFHKTNVITPNIREAEAITGLQIRDIDDMRHAAELMLTVGVENVVLKSERALEDKLVYFVASTEGECILERDRLDGRGTLGAGNVLSTAIAVSLGEGMAPFRAIERGIGLMHQAILHSKFASTESGSVNFDLNFGHEERYCKIREIG